MVVWNEANNAKVCQLAQSTELRPEHHFFANRTSIGDLTLVEASLLTSHQLICQIIKTHNIDINFKALAESMGDSKLPFPLPYPTEKISTPNTLIESRCVLYPALPSISWVPCHNPCFLNRAFAHFAGFPSVPSQLSSNPADKDFVLLYKSMLTSSQILPPNPYSTRCKTCATRPLPRRQALGDQLRVLRRPRSVHRRSKRKSWLRWKRKIWRLFLADCIINPPRGQWILRLLPLPSPVLLSRLWGPLRARSVQELPELGARFQRSTNLLIRMVRDFPQSSSKSTFTFKAGAMSLSKLCEQYPTLHHQVTFWKTALTQNRQGPSSTTPMTNLTLQPRSRSLQPSIPWTPSLPPSLAL